MSQLTTYVNTRTNEMERENKGIEAELERLQESISRNQRKTASLERIARNAQFVREASDQYNSLVARAADPESIIQEGLSTPYQLHSQGPGLFNEMISVIAGQRLLPSKQLKEYSMKHALRTMTKKEWMGLEDLYNTATQKYENPGIVERVAGTMRAAKNYLTV